MYLISIYFDEKTNETIQNYIDKVAEMTGNFYMKDMKVPPHMTIVALEARNEDRVREAFERTVKRLSAGKVQWMSVGAFLPYVLFVTPVLNTYLHELSSILFDELSSVEDVKISSYYRPFSWQPHTTVGKKLTSQEMKIAFEVLQERFVPFEGSVVKIGLAKPNPYKDIATYVLKE